MDGEFNIEGLLKAHGKKRIFRAKRKFTQAGVISHITQRAAGCEPLFLEDEDYLTMLGLLKEVSKKFDLTFHALCLMPNHVHLLLETGQENLSRAMHSVFFRYGMRFNRKYARRGHIFGSAYRQAVCLDTSYFLSASVYIHLNQVRAGLVAQAGDYRWSSCRLFCSASAPLSFVRPEFILSLLDPDRGCAVRLYGRLLEKVREVEPGNVLEEETAVEKLVSGLAGFFPRLFGDGGTRCGRGLPAGSGLLDQALLEEKILEARFWMPRSAATIRARRYLVSQLLARGYSKLEIAEMLGISRKTVYNLLARK